MMDKRNLLKLMVLALGELYLDSYLVPRGTNQSMNTIHGIEQNHPALIRKVYYLSRGYNNFNYSMV